MFRENVLICSNVKHTESADRHETWRARVFWWMIIMENKLWNKRSIHLLFLAFTSSIGDVDNVSSHLPPL
jgi:hypothetical protein